jgi:hypothetical protein
LQAAFAIDVADRVGVGNLYRAAFAARFRAADDGVGIEALLNGSGIRLEAAELLGRRASRRARAAASISAAAANSTLATGSAEGTADTRAAARRLPRSASPTGAARCRDGLLRRRIVLVDTEDRGAACNQAAQRKKVCAR